MDIFTPIANELDIAAAVIVFFAVGLMLGYIVLPLYASMTRGA
jgi:hypothetical protein